MLRFFKLLELLKGFTVILKLFEKRKLIIPEERNK